jgi:hypothetical protein
MMATAIIILSGCVVRSAQSKRQPPRMQHMILWLTFTCGPGEASASGCASVTSASSGPSEAGASSWTSVACSKQHGVVRCPSHAHFLYLAASYKCTERRLGRELHSQKRAA